MYVCVSVCWSCCCPVSPLHFPLNPPNRYQIKLEKNVTPGVTQLLLCTTGVLIRKLLSDPLLEDLTYLIVDEVHERDRNTDFLLVILRDILPLRPHLRVILMSATIEVDKFSAYFGGAPVIEMEGFTYPIRQYFLDDVLHLTDHVEPVIIADGSSGGAGNEALSSAAAAQALQRGEAVVVKDNSNALALVQQTAPPAPASVSGQEDDSRAEGGATTSGGRGSGSGSGSGSDARTGKGGAGKEEGGEAPDADGEDVLDSLLEFEEEDFDQAGALRGEVCVCVCVCVCVVGDMRCFSVLCFVCFG